MKRIGVLTSGGDCPGLNAVIRGAVKSSQQLGYECIGFLRGYEGLVDPVTYKQLNSKHTSPKFGVSERFCSAPPVVAYFPRFS